MVKDCEQYEAGLESVVCGCECLRVWEAKVSNGYQLWKNGCLGTLRQFIL